MDAASELQPIYGDWVQPVNRWQNAPNSIHNDDIARAVGMRGGTIPGSVHLNHFRPVMERLFGDRWLKSGAVSMFYTFATTDGEDVRAVVKAPAGAAPDGCYEAWVENLDGKVVAKGHVACAQDFEKLYVRALPLQHGGEVRILASLKEGAETPPVEALVAKDGEDGVVKNPTAWFGLMNAGFPPKSIAQPAVGLYGATEVIVRAGPIRVGEPYRRTGKVVAVGASPKTEYAWVDSFLHDKNGVLIAEMRHLTRWMKVSSALWKS